MSAFWPSIAVPRRWRWQNANARRSGLEDSVEFAQADLLAGVSDSSLHLVVSNPPYVASDDMATLAPDVRVVSSRSRPWRPAPMVWP